MRKPRTRPAPAAIDPVETYDILVPCPARIAAGRRIFPRPSSVSLQTPAPDAAPAARSLLRDLKRLAAVPAAPDGFRIRLRIAPRAADRPESYRLRMNAAGAEIAAADPAGLHYGTQTLLQLFVLGRPEHWRPLQIDDAPRYALRSFMVDLGRAPYPLPLLRRIVRILARLKMNVLHLHLNDNELGSLRFEGLPLGSENPVALTIPQLRSLVRYAARHHVRILPEIECWGHAGSIVYHYPELFGAPHRWGGMSLGIGEETFALFEKIFDQLLPALETDCMVHVGLDEANWVLLPSVPPEKAGDYSPTGLVARLDEILHRAGRKHGRRVTMHLWADHGGRPLPECTHCRTVVEPWMYFEGRAADIRARLRQYGGRGKPPFMMGAGMSSVHFGGHFGATKLWCRLGRKLPNVEGVTICLWEGNDLAGHLIGLFGGADYAWTPETPRSLPRAQDAHDEQLRGLMGRRMRQWQIAFRDADAAAINADRGPEVYRGLHAWGARAGQPYAPTGAFRPPLRHGSVDDTQ